MSSFKLVNIFLLLLFQLSEANFFNGSLRSVTSSKHFTNKLQEFIQRNEGTVSQQCFAGLKQYQAGLMSIKPWAFKMLDSGAKIPSGLMDGNMADLGSFDECLNSQGPEIFGQYCLGVVPLKDFIGGDFSKQSELQFQLQRTLINPTPRMTTGELDLGFKLATCLPNSCSASDVQELYARMIGPGILMFTEELCQTKLTQPDLDEAGRAAALFFGAILAVILVSTAYEVAIYYLGRKPTHPIFVAFSIITNGGNLLSTTTDANQINCIHGIRAISTMWVILGHRYAIQSMFPIRNGFNVIRWIRDETNMFILGASLAVDTFFLISGVVVAYIYMIAVSKGAKFNIFLFYIHRYLRLTPIMAVVAVIHITLVRYLGSGPLWPSSVQNSLITACQNNWWKSILYIQNTQNLEDVCVPQTWYLAVDTQLYLLSPILLLPLKYKPKFAVSSAVVLTICSIIAAFLTCWFFEFGLANASTEKEKLMNYMTFYYVATWIRMVPWLIGFVLGYYLFQLKQKKEKISISQTMVLLLWAAALAVLSTCVFAGHDLYVSEYRRAPSSLYLSLVRPSWAIAVGWVIFACVAGYGDPVDWFLSLPVFRYISRLSYALYMIHYTVIFVITGQMRSTPMFDNGSMMYAFWGDFVFCVIAAVLLTLAFESPVLAIEKIVFGRGKTK